jgi:hypothetical protein
MGEQGSKGARLGARGLMTMAARRLRSLAWVAACVASFACGGDDDDSAPSGGAGSGAESGSGGNTAGSGGKSDAGSGGKSEAGSGGAANAKSNAALYGSFDVSLVAAKEKTATSEASAAATKVVGLFYGARHYPMTLLEQQTVVGECTLSTPIKPFCEQGCTGKCTADDVCSPQGEKLPLGDIHFVIGKNEYDLEAVAHNYQLAAGEKLPYPPCDEGDTASIEVGGGDYEGFSIETSCIAVLDAGGPFPMEPGKPLDLTWSAPGDPNVASMHIKLDVSHHGGSKGQIDCDVPDTGAYSIPAELVDQLLDLGVAGFPTVQLTRNATAHPEGGEPSNVTMAVDMMVEREVTIPGLVSCSSDDKQCPDGQVCQTDLSCK